MPRPEFVKERPVRRLLQIVRQPFAAPLLARGWQRAVPLLLAVGTVAVLGGLTVIWAARLTVDHPVYVSELGAQGSPTSAVFAVALLLIAAGGFSIALASGHVRSSVRWLDRWAPAASLGFAGLCFVIASQVTCTVSSGTFRSKCSMIPGSGDTCPLPSSGGSSRTGSADRSLAATR